MMCIIAGIIYKGKLLENTFPEGIIKAGQWAYLQSWSHDDYKIVLLLPNGEINHRAIIQIFDYKKGDYTLENHYTTCGEFHCKMENYESDIKRLNAFYSDERFKVTAWVEY